MQQTVRGWFGRGKGNIRVGRWMSKTEYNQMLKTRKVQMSGGNLTHVTNPANPNAFKAAKSGSIFVEFDVPASAVVQGGKSGWGIIPGPGSMYDKLLIKQTGAGYTIPNVTNIKIK